MSDRKLNILFGSQTGTAEDVAQRIGREGQRRHLNSNVVALDEYNIAEMVNENVLVFVVSTTGQGDPPDNMKKFWKFLLRKNLPTDSLQDVFIAVIGLGDSSYLKFNFIGKKLYKRLLQLSAKPLIELASADEQHPLGLDSTIDPWLTSLWEKVLQLYPLQDSEQIIPRNVILQSKYKVTKIDEIPQKERKTLDEKIGDSNNNIYTKENPWFTSLLSNERKTSVEHYQEVLLIKFNLEHSNISYDPGDVLMIQPCNIQEKVDEFFQLVAWEADDIINVETLSLHCTIPHGLPQCMTLKYLFTNYLSLQAPPKRYFFELLSHFTTSELEKERLEEFGTAEGQEDLYDYCYKPKRNHLEVLQDFPSACENLKLEYIFDMFPIMQPRAFSIASSLKASPGCADILMAVVKYKTKMFIPRLGVCSTWLSHLNVKEECPLKVWVTKGTISFPRDPSVPVIMVGPGTGVAPFQSFIQERIYTKYSGDLVLFFGCRNANGDDFFREEWDKSMQENSNLKIFTAYSRDQTEKMYVQHRMKEQGEMIWSLLNRSAYFFIAGNSKDMPNDVITCLKEIISEQGGVADAEQYFKDLETSRRFQCETWS